MPKETQRTFGNRPTPAFLQRLLNGFDEEIAKCGFQLAHRNFAAKYRVAIQASCDGNQFDESLNDNGALVVSNHRSEIDMLPLWCTLSDRENAYAISTGDRFGIGPNYAKHLLPVHLSDKDVREGKMWFRWKRILWPPEHMPEDERKKRNTESLERAIDELSKGALVLMMPEGAQGEGASWRKGIGRIVEGLRDQWDSINYVQAHVSGTRNILLEFLRLVPAFQKKMPMMKVRYSSAQKLSDVLDECATSDVASITRQLEQNYRNWLSQ